MSQVEAVSIKLFRGLKIDKIVVVFRDDHMLLLPSRLALRLDLIIIIFLKAAAISATLLFLFEQQIVRIILGPLLAELIMALLVAAESVGVRVVFIAA